MEKFSKIFWYTVALLLIIGLILSLRNCEDKKYSKLQGSYDVLKEQYLKGQDSLVEQKKKRVADQEVYFKVIDRKEKENKILSESNKKLEQRISTIKDKEIVVPKDIPELVNYFNSRYSTLENKIIEDKVGLTPVIGSKVSYELEEKDNLNEIINIKDEQLSNNNIQINNLQDNSRDLKTMLNSAEDEIKKEEELRNLANKNIGNLEKQVKSLNRKNTFNKILIPVGIVLGGFIGYQIAK